MRRTWTWTVPLADEEPGRDVPVGPTLGQDEEDLMLAPALRPKVSTGPRRSVAMTRSSMARAISEPSARDADSPGPTATAGGGSSSDGDERLEPHQGLSMIGESVVHDREGHPRRAARIDDLAQERQGGQPAGDAIGLGQGAASSQTCRVTVVLIRSGQDGERLPPACLGSREGHRPGRPGLGKLVPCGRIQRPRKRPTWARAVARASSASWRAPS